MRSRLTSLALSILLVLVPLARATDTAVEWCNRGQRSVNKYFSSNAQEDFRIAERELKQCLSLNPDYLPGKDSLDFLYKMREVRSGARRAQLDSRGRFAELLRRGDTQGSLAIIVSEAEKDPTFIHSSYPIIAFLKAQKREDLIIKYSSEALRKNPSYNHAYSALAETWSDLGHNNKAIEMYEELLRNNRSDERVYGYYAGFAQRKLKDRKRAEEICRRHIDRFPNSRSGYSNLADLLENENPSEALRLYEKAISITPGSDWNVQEYTRIATLISKQHDLEHAISYWNGKLPLHKDYFRFYESFADFLQKYGRPGKALEHYERAASLASGWSKAQILVKIAKLQARLGNKSKAIDLLNEALLIEPNRSDIRAVRRDLFLELGEKNAAAEELRRLIIFREAVHAGYPSNAVYPLSLEEMKSLYDDVGDYRNAIESVKVLQNMTWKEVDHVRLLAELVDLYRKAGQPEVAERSYGQFRSRAKTLVSSSQGDFEILNSVARSYAIAGRDLDYALDLATEAGKIRPNDPQNMDTVAEIYFRKGNVEKAIELTQGVIRSDPSGPKIEYFKRRLQKFQDGLRGK